MMELGKRIYSYRTKLNMSQGDLADALDVSRQSVSKWENGNAVPDLDKLVKLSKLFGVTLDELVSGESNSPSPPDGPALPSHRFSRQQTAGLVFWAFFILIVLAMALSGEGISGMLPGLPFLICGCLCYGTKLKHIILWCTWVFALPAIAVPWYEYIRLPEARLITVFLWGSMLVLTWWTLRKDPVPLRKSTISLLTAGYGFWFIWFLYFLIRTLQRDIPADPRIAVDTTLLYWIDVLAYLLFISLFSVTSRLLKQMHSAKE